MTTRSFNLPIMQKKFLKHLKNLGRSSNTLKNYKMDLDYFHHYLYRKKKNPKNPASPATIKQYGSYLQKKSISDNSRRRRVQTLRIFFDFLIEKNHITSNPARLIPPSPKFLDKPRPTPFKDIKTLWKYLEEAKHNSPKPLSSLLLKRNQVIFLLIFGSGLKVSDIVKLKNKHITSGRVLVTPRKRDHYTIPLSPLFKPLYRDYITSLKKLKKSQNIKFDTLCFNANAHHILSGGLTARGIEMIFEESRNRLKLTTLTPKSLRQACIFKWLSSGIKESLIKEWMGVAPSYDMNLYQKYSKKFHYDENI